MKRKIAIFHSSKFDYETFLEEHCIPKGYTQLTEWVKIDFPEISKANTITNKINCIDEEINNIKESTTEKIKKLSTRKEELLELEVNNEYNR